MIYNELTAELFGSMLRTGAARLLAEKEKINSLNVFPVPDGDTGDNMYMTIKGGVSAIENCAEERLGDYAAVLSRGMLLGARGNSGVILSRLFAGISKAFAGKSTADLQTVALAMENGVKEAYSSVMNPTEGTILTVAREGVEKAASEADKNDLEAYFAALTDEMELSLARTPELLEALRQAQVVDSGGAGLLCIFRGMLSAIRGDTEKFDDVAPVAKLDFDEKNFFGYCTELLVKLGADRDEASSLAEIKEYLTSVGESVVCFGEGGIVKLHVHTKKPEDILAFCHKYGEFVTLKIENMSVSHTESVHEDHEHETAAPVRTRPSEQKKFAVVAVANGDGIEALLGDLGADAIIRGGQTENPSTADFLEAFGSINAEYIFVFPNNGNIVMAAEQACGEYNGEHTDSHAVMLPAKNIGACCAALTAVDLTDAGMEVGDATEAMLSAIDATSTGFVARSIRTVRINGVKVKQGDYIAIAGKKVISDEPERLTSALKLAEVLLKKRDTTLLNVFYGKNVDEEEREKFESLLAENAPQAEVYPVYGGQKVYDYIITATLD